MRNHTRFVAFAGVIAVHALLGGCSSPNSVDPLRDGDPSAGGASGAGGTAGTGGTAGGVCAAGTFDDDGKSDTACVPFTNCAPGQSVASPGSPTEDRTCAGCPSGTFTETDNAPGCTSWKTCAVGTRVTNEPSASEDRDCEPCAEGTTTAGDNEAVCAPFGACSAGTLQTAPGAGTTPPVCESCEAGTYCAGDQAPKLPCAAGSWDHDASSTTACTPKTNCVAGQSVASEGTATEDRSCAGCANGGFSTETNADSCTPWADCLAGTHVARMPSATSDRRCEACAEGTYTAGVNQASCLPLGVCAAGTVQTAAGTGTAPPVCESCESGTYCAGDQATKLPCAATSWDHDSSAATACTPKTACVAGQSVANEGTTLSDRACAACGSGSFSTQQNEATCAGWTDCQPGKHVTRTPSAISDRTCAVCAEGTYTTGLNEAACNPWKCTPNAVSCDGTTPKTCNGNGSGYASAGTNCAASGQICSAGSCVSPSCAGGLDCGGVSCCKSIALPGGTYQMGRSTVSGASDYYSGGDSRELPEHPATVAGFSLDKYEVTVGRFRKFVEQYTGAGPAVGTGAHPLIAGTGWQSAWNASLPTSQASLKTNLACDVSYQTWTDSVSAKERYAINCVSWVEAMAFCVWDGGRLPTEAEWEYAAAGGSENRLYPWGSQAPDGTRANFYGGAYTPYKDVGTTPLGDGRWGQSDLAGGMWEWAYDWFDSGWYGKSNQCNNCANTTTASNRVGRGGSWGSAASYLRAAYRLPSNPTNRIRIIGFRCARSAP